MKLHPHPRDSTELELWQMLFLFSAGAAYPLLAVPGGFDVMPPAAAAAFVLIAIPVVGYLSLVVVYGVTSTGGGENA